MLTKFRSKRTREADETALRGRITVYFPQSENTCNRSCKDDSAMFLPAHRYGRVLREKKAGLEIGRKKPVPIRRCPIGQGDPMVDAGVGDHDVEAAMVRDDRVDGGPPGSLVGHIEGRGFGLQSALAEIAHDLFERDGVAAVGDDGGPGYRQSLGHRKPKAARGASDERNSPTERKNRIGGSHVVPQAVLIPHIARSPN